MLASAAGSGVKTIGYLVPEFPGQTHNFFWRERQALLELGVATRLVSTRRPPSGIVSASWAGEAIAATAYLHPMSAAEFFGALGHVFAAGPAAWQRCARLVARARGLSFRQRLKFAALIPFAAKLARLGRKQGWSHVHVHSCADAANIALLASQLSDCTYSLTLHGHLAVYGPNQEQKWSHAAFAILITRTLHDEVTRLIGAHLPRKTVIAPMGVDVEKFARTAPYAPPAADGEVFVFSCGRLNQGKGYQHLLQATSLLRQQGVNVRVEIAGEDEQGGAGYRGVLERRIRELSLGDAVTLLGAVSEEKIRERLLQAHVFVLASLHEALGVVLMEAMAMGVPAVASDVGGVHELVENGVDGILVPPGDPAEIAAAVRRLAQDPALAARLGDASRRKIAGSFSHRRSAAAIARLLDDMRQSRQAVRGGGNG